MNGFQIPGILVVVASLLVTQGAFGVTLLGVAWSPSDSAVYRIDSESGEFSFLGQSGFPGLNSLVSVNGRIFTMSSRGIGPLPQLVEIDPRTGVGTSVGEVFGIGTSVDALTWREDLGLLATDGRHVYQVPLIPRPDGIIESVRISESGTLSGAYQGMEIAPNGRLYLSESNGYLLSTVDPLTLNVIRISTTTGEGSLALEFLPDGRLVGYGRPEGTFGDQHTLLHINPLTGTRTEIGPTNGPDIRGLAVIPEPGSGLLILIGLLLAGSRRQRRKFQ